MEREDELGPVSSGLRQWPGRCFPGMRDMPEPFPGATIPRPTGSGCRRLCSSRPGWRRLSPILNRFMEALPTVSGFGQQQAMIICMKMWEGLGYYSRARNLKAAAKMICEDTAAVCLASREELLKLPGNRKLHGGSHRLHRLRHTGSGCGRQCAAGYHKCFWGTEATSASLSVKTRIEAGAVRDHDSGSDNAGQLQSGAYRDWSPGLRSRAENPNAWNVLFTESICLTGKKWLVEGNSGEQCSSQKPGK